MVLEEGKVMAMVFGAYREMGGIEGGGNDYDEGGEGSRGKNNEKEGNK